MNIPLILGLAKVSYGGGNPERRPRAVTGVTEWLSALVKRQKVKGKPLKSVRDLNYAHDEEVEEHGSVRSESERAMVMWVGERERDHECTALNPAEKKTEKEGFFEQDEDRSTLQKRDRGRELQGFQSLGYGGDSEGQDETQRELVML